MLTISKSSALFAQAQQFIPGGVNSPVRAFKGVGGTPLFIKEGHGAYLIDENDHRYIDYVGSWGPIILGHAHPTVVKAVQETAAKGLSFGAPTELEVEMAKQICHFIPSMSMVRLVNSGTEATMSAIRLARAFTSRNKIVKFEGCYHGHSDALLVNAGSGLLTLGIPSSSGVPPDLVQHTLTAGYNNLDSVIQLFEKYGKEIAAIIVEPVAANMNCIPPLPGFLEGLREVCNHYQSLLIFDEVITGFRVALGGAQERFHIKPDLTTLGKIIGGGMPIGAFGGRKEIMEYIAPLGPVYQAGTLSGNPVATAAGIATLKEITKPGFYENLELQGQLLVEGFSDCAKSAGIPLQTHRVGSMFGLFFTDKNPIIHYKDVMECNTTLFKYFFHSMLAHGVYLAPSAFESGFISIAHGREEITQTLLIAEKVMANIKQKL